MNLEKIQVLLFEFYCGKRTLPQYSNCRRCTCTFKYRGGVFPWTKAEVTPIFKNHALYLLVLVQGHSKAAY